MCLLWFGTSGISTINRSLEREKLSGLRSVVNWSVLTENPSCLGGKMFPGHATLQLLRETQTTMEENRSQPEQFEDRIILMSMFHDIDWGTSREAKKLVFRILQKFRRAHKDFLKGIGHFSDQELKKRGAERTPTKQTVCGTMLLRWWL